MPLTLHVNRDSEREKLSDYWKRHPWNFLTARDLDGRPVIWTADEKEKDPAKSVKPFPTDKPYLFRMVNLIVSPEPEDRVLLFDKARQMIVTTTVLMVIRWWCAVEEARQWLISKRIKDEAVDLLKIKVRNVQQRMPEWVREHDVWRISDKPQAVINFPNTSIMEAVAQNVAAGASRGKTATGILVDEAAFQIMFGGIWSAVEPMCYKFIGVSTPNNDGSAGAIAWNELLDEGKAVRNPYDLEDETETETVEAEPRASASWAHDGDPTDPDYD